MYKEAVAAFIDDVSLYSWVIALLVLEVKLLIEALKAYKDAVANWISEIVALVLEV